MKVLIKMKETTAINVVNSRFSSGAFAPLKIMEYNKISDFQLIKMVILNDQKAFKEIFERYSKRIFNLVYKYTQDYHASQDITQEIFLKVYTHAKDFNMKSQFSTWLYRIAVNESITYLRKNKNNRHLLDIDAVENIASSYQEEAKDDNNRSNLGMKILESLPDNQKIAFTLASQYGKKYKEIGIIMKISEKAVESLIYRARENMRGKLSLYKNKGEI